MSIGTLALWREPQTMWHMAFTSWWLLPCSVMASAFTYLVLHHMQAATMFDILMLRILSYSCEVGVKAELVLLPEANNAQLYAKVYTV